MLHALAICPSFENSCKIHDTTQPFLLSTGSVLLCDIHQVKDASEGQDFGKVLESLSSCFRLCTLIHLLLSSKLVLV